MLPSREGRMAVGGASGRAGRRLAVGFLGLVTISNMAAAREPDGRWAAGGADDSIDAGGLEAPAAPAPLAPEKHAATQHLSDLSIGNFFTEGWNQGWEKWRHYTPDMALLRVTTNFLERELRADYAKTEIAHSAATDSTDFVNVLMAYALNRRLMLEVIGNYQWNDRTNGTEISGSGAGFLARFQLVENPDQSYSFQARVSAPNKGIGGSQTSLQFGLAGWQDVHSWVPALGKFGLYYSFTYENLLGDHAATATTNDVSYDVSFAETWTTPSTKSFGNFTTFLEFFGQTFLDGSSSGRTNVTVTPGFRFWFVPENSISFGVDFPVSHRPPIHNVYRATYILNF
jgi:hypothetical protein